MASSPILDIDTLLEPLPGDNPAGDPHAYVDSVRAELQELRREERAEDYDDATRPAQLKKADWSGVVRVAQEALRTKSKDLRIACHLAEGAVKVEGFAGLRDSLQLLHRLTDECWDRLNPPWRTAILTAEQIRWRTCSTTRTAGSAFPTLSKRYP